MFIIDAIGFIALGVIGVVVFVALMRNKRSNKEAEDDSTFQDKNF